LNLTTEGIYKENSILDSKDESAMNKMKINQLKNKSSQKGSSLRLQNKRAHHPTIHLGGE
jgi:hypothetical protein